MADINAWLRPLWADTRPGDTADALVLLAQELDNMAQDDIARVDNILDRRQSSTMKRRWRRIVALRDSVKKQTVTEPADQIHIVDTPEGRWVVELPDDILDIDLIQDNPASPTFQWARGTHFDIVDGQLLLPVDPFTKSFKTAVDQGGPAVEMWAFQATVPNPAKWATHGLFKELNTGYGLYWDRLWDAAWDLRVEPPTDVNFNRFLMAMLDSDAPTSSGAVQSVATVDGRTVVTAVDGRTFSSPNPSLVDAGDSFEAGAILFKGAEVSRTWSDAVPFPALSIGKVQLPYGRFPMPPTEDVILSRTPATMLTNEGTVIRIDEMPASPTGAIEYRERSVPYDIPVGGSAEDVEAFRANAAWYDDGPAAAALARGQSDVNPMEECLRKAVRFLLVRIDRGMCPDVDLTPMVVFLRRCVPARLMCVFHMEDSMLEFSPTVDEELSYFLAVDHIDEPDALSELAGTGLLM